MKSKRKRVDSDGLLKRKAGGSGGKSNPFETVVMASKYAVLNRDPQSKQPSAIRKRAIDNRKQTLGKEFAVLHKTNRFTDARKDDFTKATHFGGGSDDEGETGRRDRKTVIEEMIAESKRLKAEKQRANDLVFEKSQELDKDLQLLMSKVGAHIRKEHERSKPDDYDRAMREMVFERRGTPAEKLKSEQLARREQERRERQEQERLERMKNDEIDRGKDKSRKHLSADALDDGYLLDGDDNNGLEQDDDETGNEVNRYDPRKVSQEAVGKSSSNQDGSEEEESDDEDEDEASGSDADSLSDLKNAAPASDEEEEDEESEPEEKREPEKQAQQVALVSIPRFIEIPKQYEDFSKLLETYTVEQQALIVEKVVQKANENNQKAKAQRSVLFVYVIQHLVDRFTASSVGSIETDFKALHLLTPLLYDLAQKDTAGTSAMFHDILQEKYGDFQQHPQRHPPLASLIILKLVPLLFSASDARHAIVTPGLIFISELLTRCPIRNRRQIACGLLMVTTVLECVEFSKRFLPATLSFLAGVINLACPPIPPHVTVKCVHPFKTSAVSLLPAPADDTVKAPSEGLKLTAEDLIRAEMTESFKVRAVATAVAMISTMATQLTDCPAIQTMAKFFLNQLEGLEKVSYPAKVKTLLKKTRSKLTQLADRPVRYLVAAEQKPKPLRLLEPKIYPVYDDIRSRPKTELSLREQRKKLLQKVKKEKRGAAREIRLDNEYLAKLKHKRRMESDRERKEKVKRIFSDATTQQSELNSLDRKAKYRK
uniref:Uncharacterized protein n=1 Tax=Anopheles atroparvus TaxID=41427 RepID=A0A182IL93_ANOAO